MDANMLCSILAQRIPPEQYRLDGLEVRWASPVFDTKINRAIVADVMASYDALADAYIAEQEQAERVTAIKGRLKEIDGKSIRSIREWIAAQPTAPQWVKDYDAEASVEREKLK